MAQQQWVTSSLGGNLTNNKLSMQLRNQALPMFVYRQFAQIKDEGLGRQTGDTIYFEKILRINTRGGTLAETNTVPANLVKVIKDSCVVSEWGKLVAPVLDWFNSVKSTVSCGSFVAGLA